MTPPFPITLPYFLLRGRFQPYVFAAEQASLFGILPPKPHAFLRFPPLSSSSLVPSNHDVPLNADAMGLYANVSALMGLVRANVSSIKLQASAKHTQRRAERYNTSTVLRRERIACRVLSETGRGEKYFLLPPSPTHPEAKSNYACNQTESCFGPITSRFRP